MTRQDAQMPERGDSLHDDDATDLIGPAEMALAEWSEATSAGG